MPISAINLQAINEGQKTTQLQQKYISYKANPNNTLERNPQSDGFDKSKKHTGLWVTLGVLATAGLAIGFDFWKYKGQHCKDLWGRVKGMFGKGKSKPTGEAPLTNTATPKPTNYSLADFKKNGKFEKGKALLNDGSAYTGTIKHTTDEGVSVEIKYEKGEIKNVLAFKKNDQGANEKLGTWVSDNGLVSIETDHLPNKDRGIWYFLRIDESGNITKTKYEQFNKIRNGETLALMKETDMETGKIIRMGNRLPKNPSDYFHDHVMIDGKKIKLEYNDKAKLYRAFDTSFDRNACVYKNQFYEKNSEGNLVPINKYRLTNKYYRNRSVYYELDSKGNIINARLLPNSGDMSKKRSLSAEEVKSFAEGKILAFDEAEAKSLDAIKIDDIIKKVKESK